MTRSDRSARVSIPLIVLTNGRRDCIFRSISSVTKHLFDFGDTVIVDDSGDSAYRMLLMSEFPDAVVTAVAEEAVGYWRAMQKVWSIARDSGSDSVIFWEDDFVLTDDVFVTNLNRVLDEQPHLTQIALLRQPWFENEHLHGGLIEALEAQGQRFDERTDGEHHWIEHRACFTGNPSLIPRHTFNRDWPRGPWSESRFGQQLFSNGLARGAYWGKRDDRPRVEHIGSERVGTEY